MSGIGPIISPTWTPYDRLILKTANLIAYWPLTEAAGTRASEVKGGLHGVYTGAGLVLGELGPVVSEPGTAALFDASTAFVTVPNNAALQPTPPMTLEAWMQCPSGAAQTIAGRYSGNGYLLELGTSGQLVGYLTGGANITYTGAGTDLRGTAWHHVALCGTATALDLWTDGLLVHHVAGTWTWASVATALLIGERSAGVQLFNGRIGRVALYSRDLGTTGELAAHNAAGRA
jgi:hypothetical protein